MKTIALLSLLFVLPGCATLALPSLGAILPASGVHININIGNRTIAPSPK